MHQVEFESLERRQLLSGNIKAALAKGLLTVTGDEGANAITVSQLSNGNTQILGAAGTRINGHSSYQAAGVTAVTLSLHGGNDAVTLSGLKLSGNLIIDGGAGADAVILSKTSALNLVIYGNSSSTAAENDSISIVGGGFRRQVRIDSGAGSDIVGLRDTTATGGVAILGASSASTMRVGFSGVTAGGTSAVSTGSGSDALDIVNSKFATFSGKLRGGNDKVYVRGTTFVGDAPIDAGTGRNSVNREVTLSWNFANGLQNWEPGIESVFVNLNKPETSEQLLNDNHITHGLAVVKGSGGKDVPAYVFGGAADLWYDYVYLQRKIGATDGLVAKQKYSLTFNVQETQNEDVDAYFGATSFNPTITQTEHGTRQGTGRLNLDRGTFKFPGKDVSHHTSGQSGTLVTDKYTHPTAISTDANGTMYLHVGDDRIAGDDTPGTPGVGFCVITVTLTPV